MSVHRGINHYRRRKGRVDCVIRARLQSALLRAADEQAISWGALK